MTYIADDKSVESGSPIEFYEFIGPTASFEYFYTSYHGVLPFNGETFVPMPGIRSEQKVATESEDVDIEVTLPVSAQVVQDFGFGIPMRSLHLNIYRQHGVGGAFIQMFDGEVSFVSAQGVTAAIKARPVLVEALSRTLPGVYYQPLCNHFLYDTRCGISEAANTYATTVSSIPDPKQIVVASVDGNPNQWYRFGEIKRTSDGESRTILDQTGTTLTISHPFREITTLDDVDIIAGCDLLVATCRDKFSNVVNFGGWPYIPNKHIINAGIRNI